MALSLIWTALIIITVPSAAENKIETGQTDKNLSSPDASDKNKTDISLKYEFKNALILNYTMLQKLRNAPSVGVAFFYSKRFKAVPQFFFEYDKSASFLNAYGIMLGVVDCTANMADLTAVCAKETKRRKVLAYRQGEEMLALDLDVMFDVNSIMSNILQLALLNDVAIIQSEDERKVVEKENAGQKDVIFSYHAAIGTYEHRVFMEVAFAYRDKYKFYVTTQMSSIAGLQNTSLVTESTMSAVWMLYCKEKYDALNGCHSNSYRGPLTLQGFASFVKLLSQPRVFYHLQDGLKPSCETMACIYIRHTSDTKASVAAVIDAIQFIVHGKAGLIVEERHPSVIPPLTPDPQIELSTPGMEKSIMMEQEWTKENVEAFISSVLFGKESEMAQGVSPPLFSGESQNITEDTVMDIDDMVMHVAVHTEVIPEQIPALSDTSFPETVAKSKLLVVYFYLPFDSRSTIFLHELEEVASNITDLQKDPPHSHPLARVNCYDWTDVCQKENIATYPSLRIYRNGQRQDYNDVLDKDVVIRMIRLLQMEQPLILKTVNQVTDFLSGRMPEDVKLMTDNLVILRPSSSMKEMEDYGLVVKSFESHMLFAVVEPQVDTNYVPETSIVHVRLSDHHMPIETLHDPFDAELMKSFLMKGQFHLLPELTHLNFPALYAKKQPFGVLFLSKDGSESQILEENVVAIVKAKMFPEVIFCKMTIDSDDSIASSILRQYLGSLLVPSFVIVWHQEGKIFAQYGPDTSQFSEKALSNWIRGVFDGSENPFKVLRKGEWKPHGQHYDFLTLIERERQMKNTDEEEMINHDSSSSCDGTDCDITMQGATGTGIKMMAEKEDADSDIRTTMLELQHSRLYSGKERRSHTSAAAHHSEAAFSTKKNAEMEIKADAPQTGGHASDSTGAHPALSNNAEMKKMDKHTEL